MKHIKIMLGLLILVSTFAQADESSVDKVKNGALELWEKTKVTTSEITSSASNQASKVGEKASKIGNEVSENTKETGVVVWDKMKKIGTATADGAKKGVSKVREFVGDEKCEEGDTLCYK